jgi:hypothetical protein
MNIDAYFNMWHKVLQRKMTLKVKTVHDVKMSGK